MALIRFYKPALYRKDMDAVLQTMVDEKIGPGERKREFISAACSLVGKKSGIALRSYIDLIILSLESFGVASGDSVIISVLSPRVYLDAFKRLDIKAILIDVDDEMMPSIDKIKENLDSAKALVLYEPLCQIPRNIDEYKGLGIPILEDISQSIGSTFGDIKAGSIGDIVIASTEEEDLISTGGGAFGLTDSEDLLENLKKAMGNSSSYLELPDMNAALGIVQISKMDTILQRRNNIYKVYQQSAMKCNAKVFGSGSIEFFSNGSGFSVIVKSRPDDTIEFAKKYQVSAKKTFTHAIGARYQDKFDRFPKAIPALTRGVSFPLYPFLSNVEIDTIQKVISHLH